MFYLTACAPLSGFRFFLSCSRSRFSALRVQPSFVFFFHGTENYPLIHLRHFSQLQNEPDLSFFSLSLWFFLSLLLLHQISTPSCASTYIQRFSLHLHAPSDTVMIVRASRPNSPRYLNIYIVCWLSQDSDTRHENEMECFGILVNARRDAPDINSETWLQ